MFDPRYEKPIPLSEVPNLSYLQLRGSKLHKSTVYRWALRGLKGVRLETIEVGGTTCTSEESLSRFFNRKNECAGKNAMTATADSKDDDDDDDDDDAVLARAGLL